MIIKAVYDDIGIRRLSESIFEEARSWDCNKDATFLVLESLEKMNPKLDWEWAGSPEACNVGEILKYFIDIDSKNYNWWKIIRVIGL